MLVVPSFENFDLDEIIMPIDISSYSRLLHRTGYDSEKARFLLKGFSSGFDLGYSGPTLRRDKARNIPFTVENKYDMWAKIMKEVEHRRYAGPFHSVPYDYYVQSPIGLVPKSGNRTHLIFFIFRMNLKRLSRNQ